MLYAFGFDRVGVLVSDMYIVIPTPRPGQEGSERGVRLEVRLLERGELPGSIYSAPSWPGRGFGMTMYMSLTSTPTRSNPNA